MSRPITVVVYESATGQGDWKPVERGKIPEWITQQIMAEMVYGKRIVHDGITSDNYYRAERVITQADAGRLAAAEAKRARRRQRNLKAGA